MSTLYHFPSRLCGDKCTAKREAIDRLTGNRYNCDTMRKATKSLPKVAVSLSSTYITNRQILGGILKFMKLNSPWDGAFITGRADDPSLDTILDENTKGLITDELTPEVRALVDKYNIATVTVLFGDDSPNVVGKLVGDSVTVGRMVAEHFLKSGFKHFAYVEDLARTYWSMPRYAGFRDALSEAGFDCSFYRSLKATAAKPKDDRARLSRWLEALPKPCAIFAANDVRARHVIEACRTKGLTVPGQIALVGADNDAVLCETASPAITSVEWNTVDYGYRIAEFLDTVIRTGRRPDKQRVFTYSGSRLVVRASSLMNATGDPLVEECREYLSQSLDKKLTTASISSALNISRRTLERRFYLGAGHSLRTEIQMMRMTLAKQLLEETDFRLEDIAFKCGFYDVSHMRQTFARFGSHLSAKKQRLKA